MTADPPLHRRSLSRLGRDLRTGRLTAQALTEALLARIQALDPVLHAFTAVDAGRALAAARRADSEAEAGHWRGPLHGIPVALKDAIDRAGLPTALGSQLFAGQPARADATLWRRLAAAGAICLGKLDCVELCLGLPSDDGAFPHARNPWDAARSPGGSSSGGGVALAAGMVPAAIGTDAGGSIRIPAAACGVVGLKPTRGRVPMGGVAVLSPSLDHAGPMARSVRDCALLLDAMARTATEAALTDRLDGLRVGNVTGWTNAPEVATGHRRNCAAMLDRLARLGAEIIDIDLPLLADYTLCTLVLMKAEAFARFAPAFRRAPERIGRHSRLRIGLGAFLTAEDYQRAQAMRGRLAAAMERALRGLDVLLCPGMLADPPVLAGLDPLAFLDLPLITAPANLSGGPSLSLPTGLSAAGLPMAVQITGRRGDDATVLRVGHALERALALDLAPPVPG